MITYLKLEKVLRDLSHTQDVFSKLLEASNKVFSSLKKRVFLTEK